MKEPDLRGRVLRLMVTPEAGAPMKFVSRVVAVTGRGLEGDRYAMGVGSWTDKADPHKPKRHVSIIDVRNVLETDFGVEETRRNIATTGIDLERLIGQEFMIGDAIMRGVDVCTPCDRPSHLCGREGFKETFAGILGGIYAEVLSGGAITLFAPIIFPRDIPGFLD